MTIRRISLPLLIALALAGCANGDPVAAPVGAPAASSPAPGSVAPIEESGTVKPPAGEVQTLTGTISAGVEPNCLLLGEHLLIIGDPELQSAAKVGATVTVTGRAEQGTMTTCQQGTPFLVATLRAN